MNGRELLALGGTAEVVGRCRYSLTRGAFLVSPYALYVGLNPSKAGPLINDPTVRVFARYTAETLRLSAFAVANVIPIIATDPREMLRALPLSEDEKRRQVECVRGLAKNAHTIVACWGANAHHPTVLPYVHDILGVLVATGKTVWRFGPALGSGAPHHALYLRRDVALETHVLGREPDAA